MEYGNIIDAIEMALAMDLSEEGRVRIYIPDEPEPNHDAYHGVHGVIVREASETLRVKSERYEPVKDHFRTT